jgi:pyruvate,orthophosphate dikinase
MRVYLFEEGNANLRMLLGGKGANLAEMTNIGLPVPPGITLTTEACKEYYSNECRLSEDLKREVADKLKVVEKKAGKVFGDPFNALLVSVRSGAPVSMPGMMDTVLNLGLNDETVKCLIKQTGNEGFAYDCYRRFIQMFSKIVLGIRNEKFEKILEDYKERLGVGLDIELGPEVLKEIVKEYKNLTKTEVGREFPEDPYEQLYLAIGAVFNSWNTSRAKSYRRINKISEDLCTGVNIQVMVFGNMGPSSGSGVAFTRDPSTGEKKLYGEYLMNAQGEDVVAGIRTPINIDQIMKEAPEIYRELSRICSLLESHYKDMQDIEFTIENNSLYILQTRTGQRTVQAVLKIAVEMVKEELINKEEAILRVQPEQVIQLLHKHIDPKVKVQPIAVGLPASPGAASGIVIFDVDEAERLGNEGEKVILVRTETTPEDIRGMVAAQGVLTSRGGITSHAAVVARGMGKPCVVGCEEIKVDLEAEKFYVKDLAVEKGEVITIDGASGQVIIGEVPVVDLQVSQDLNELLGWADEFRTLAVRTNADTPENAAKALELGCEGIGLCRTERMFNAQDRLPFVQDMILARTEEERKEALKKLHPMQKGDFKGIFRVMDGLPVCIRLLDLPLHEFLPSLEDLLVDVTTLKLKGGDEKGLKEKEAILRKVSNLREHNPMLGHRGCRLGIAYPEIYEMQTRAIFEAATELHKEGISVDLEIMLPLVGVMNELRFLRERVERVALEVMREAEVDIKYIIGTMMEVPRACLTADEVAEYADFFSFGTNDLTQAVFSYSRDDAEGKFLHLYLDKKILKVNPFRVLDRSGVGKIMKEAVKLGLKKKKRLKLGICGEHGGNHSSIEFFHQIGLDYVSCSPFRVPIARLSAAQARLTEINKNKK